VGGDAGYPLLVLAGLADPHRDGRRPAGLGSLVFGAGWGLAGYCPGPALVSLGWSGLKPLLFVAAMVGGMALFEFFERRRTPP